MDKIKIAVIADDFTGASDAASFLVKSGSETILLTDIPDKFSYECDAMVIALKIRSVEPEEAIEKIARTVDFLKSLSIEKIYYKYCSTFDSTPKGNIGIVMDYLLERFNIPFSVLCPSLPINGRTVKDGVLYVDGVKLSESPMQNHPLNPMWDSEISKLMKEQSKYKCYVITKEELENDTYLDKIQNYIKTDDHFYIVPDYEDTTDAELICNKFNNLVLYSGGSGLLEFLTPNIVSNTIIEPSDYAMMKSVILCGSCSDMTAKQVNYFKNTDNCYIKIDTNQLMKNKVTHEEVFQRIEKNQPKTTLVYSDGCEIKPERNDSTLKEKSKKMEQLFSDIAKDAKRNSYNKIIVGGGETSGAVVLNLGYKAFYVGKSVAPGVPVLTPLENQEMRLILKSGNFGKEDFFVKALEAK